MVSSNGGSAVSAKENWRFIPPSNHGVRWQLIFPQLLQYVIPEFARITFGLKIMNIPSANLYNCKGEEAIGVFIFFQLLL